MEKKKKKVLFVHYRTGSLDGVSLEIEKRAMIFRQLGAEVYYLTGFDPLNKNNVFLVPEIDLSSNLTKIIYNLLFEKNIFNNKIAKEIFLYAKKTIFGKFDKVFKDLKPDLVAVHNIFSHACNLPVSFALLEILDKYRPKTTVLSHDFWFEGQKYKKPQFNFVSLFLKNLPPKRSYIIKHQVINSLAQDALFKRRKIKAERIGDFFDFSDKILKKAKNKKNLLKFLGIKKNDFIILQATRIARRKAIENAILFAERIKREIEKNAPIKLKNKTLKKNSNVFILLPNFIEYGEEDYWQELKKLAKQRNVNLLWAGDKFDLSGKEKNLYSFWASYLVADIVTYTSYWEGFGNQFLEAVYFKKPIVLFEYPVFRKDIKKEGYKYISLGAKVVRKKSLNFVSEKKISEAAKKMVAWLKKGNIEEDLSNNFEIAKNNHSVSLLKNEFEQILNNI